MPSMYEDWFHYRPSGEPVEWTLDCDETTHMRAFLSGLVSAEDTASKLVQTSTDPSDDIGNKQWRLWNLLFDIAAELPETQCHLVTLLKAFQTLDNPGDWETDWTKLGSFGSMWRDAWNCKYSLPYWQDTPSSALYTHNTPAFSGRHLDPTPAGRIAYSIRWINFNAISARLVANAMGNVDIVFGFFILRDGLEETLSADAIKVEPSAAAQWILLAGKQIFKADNAMMEHHWERGLAKESELWKGAVGFSRTRWNVWRRRFGELSERDDITNEVKNILDQAARKMQEIEKGEIS